MSLVTKTLNPAGSSVKGAKYLEDYFSTVVYEGTGSAKTVKTGVDLSGDNRGAIIITEIGSSAVYATVFSTEYGINALHRMNSDGPNEEKNSVTSFDSDGFSIGSSTQVNRAGRFYIATTFKCVENFFDIVSYDGDSGEPRSIKHNLKTAPAMIWTFPQYTGSTKYVYTRMTGAGDVMQLNSSGTEFDNPDTYINGGENYYTLGDDSDINNPNYSYKAFLFADHSYGGGDFGENSDENVTGTVNGLYGSSNSTVQQFQFEPEYILCKTRAGYTGNWAIITHNGYGGSSHSGSNSPSYIEYDSSGTASATSCTAISDGFHKTTTGSDQNRTSPGVTVYFGIKRAKQKPIETASEGFQATTYTANNADGRVVGLGFDQTHPDVVWVRPRVSVDSYGFKVASKHSCGNGYFFHTNGNSHSVAINSDALMPSKSNGQNFSPLCGINGNDYGMTVGNDASYRFNYSNSAMIAYAWKRSPYFFDSTKHYGTGVVKKVPHYLKTAPEMFMFKSEHSSGDWAVYHKDLNSGVNPEQYYLRLHTNSAEILSSTHWNDTPPSSDSITVGTDYDTNGDNYFYDMFLYATQAGISKVGSYTGTGNDLTVDCGFNSGTQFLLIKRVDSTGDWYVFDSKRGLTTGNVPYIKVNGSTAEVTNTDYIDPDDSGFIVTSSATADLNASGGRYIFYAIAQ